VIMGMIAVSVVFLRFHIWNLLDNYGPGREVATDCVGNDRRWVYTSRTNLAPEDGIHRNATVNVRGL